MPRSKPRSKPTDEPAPPVLSLKEELALKRKVAQERKELIQFSTYAVFGAVALGLPLMLIADPKVGLGAIVAVLCISFSYKYPRAGLWMFIAYLPFNGTVTYGLAGGSSLFQLAKDVFYIPALIALVQECRRNKLPLIIPKQLTAPLGILTAFSVLTVFFVNGWQQLNPDSVGTLAQQVQFTLSQLHLGQPILSGIQGLRLPLGMISEAIGTGFHAISQPIMTLAQAEKTVADKPLLVGILGLKVLLGYIPLIFCAYHLLRDKKDLHWLLRVVCVLIIICCALGFVQYQMLRTGRCTGTSGLGKTGAALFKASLEARCFVGGSLLYTPEQGVIRLPGTFVAPWQWGWYLISSAFFSFATAFSDPKFIWRNVGLAAMASTFIMAVISGQRIALGIVPLAFILLLFLTGQIANLKRFIPIGVGLATLLAIAMAANPAVMQERIDSFQSRWNAAPPQDFIVNQFQQSLGELQGSLLGKGVGRATNSCRVFGKVRLVETFYPKLLYEIGPVGVLAFIAVVTVLTIQTFKAYRSAKDRSLRSYGACFWVFVLFISINTYYYPLDVDPVAVYYWFFAGVILKLPEIDKQERLLQAATPAQEQGSKGVKGQKMKGAVPIEP